MDDKIKRISGMLCDILRLANGQVSVAGADKYLIDDTELINDLLNRKYKSVSNLNLIVNDAQWKQCDYILHAIFWALHDKVPFKVLENVSDEKILLLRDMINVAKNRAPLTDEDIDFAQKLCGKYKRENDFLRNNEFKKMQNNIIRFSASLTVTVAKNWKKVIAEFEKWSNYIDERIAVSGLDKAKRKRPLNLPLNPGQKEVSATVAALETPATPQQKHVDKKAKKEKTMETKPVVAQEPISESTELWTTETLAQKLGLKSKAGFAMKKMKFLKKHPEHRDTIQGWFTKNGARFKAEHFEELKQLFAKYTKRAKTVATPTPVADAQIDAILRGTNGNNSPLPGTDDCLIVSENHQMFAVSPGMERIPIGGNNCQIIDKPKDLVGIKALMAYLEKTKKLCEQKKKEQQGYKDSYTDLQKQADEAKKNETAAAQRVSELQGNISAAETLLDEYNDAENSLIAAKKLMDEKRGQLDKFLIENQALQM